MSNEQRSRLKIGQRFWACHEVIPTDEFNAPCDDPDSEFDPDEPILVSRARKSHIWATYLDEGKFCRPDVPDEEKSPLAGAVADLRRQLDAMTQRCNRLSDECGRLTADLARADEHAGRALRTLATKDG